MAFMLAKLAVATCTISMGNHMDLSLQWLLERRPLNRVTGDNQWSAYSVQSSF